VLAKDLPERSSGRIKKIKEYRNESISFFFFWHQTIKGKMDKNRDHSALTVAILEPLFDKDLCPTRLRVGVGIGVRRDAGEVRGEENHRQSLNKNSIQLKKALKCHRGSLGHPLGRAGKIFCSAAHIFKKDQKSRKKHHFVHPSHLSEH